MKSRRLYKVKMLDGSQYRGEITYRDNKMLILRISRKFSQQKLRLFYNGIMSIQELGWQKPYVEK
ncbi:MAG: hypothetical protein JSV97_06430 [candidate division WOR-3 bacterium]|nr:MAG: hypothetical protein JSV97_06430 [candidate division WOR-3 bacterium]